MRQVVLDTETTGLEPEKGHRVVELGAVEIVDRRLTGRRLRHYIDPERDIDDAAYEVHGLDRAFLKGNPTFRQIAKEFLDFVRGAELVIHNAPFDVSFLDYELSLLDPALFGETRSSAASSARGRLQDLCSVTDSLAVARRKHPGQRNGLDALCRRYRVDNSNRDLHGALLDAELLADVYLAMTGGQMTLFQAVQSASAESNEPELRLPADRPAMLVRHATADELVAHEAYLDVLDRIAGEGALWRQLSLKASPVPA